MRNGEIVIVILPFISKSTSSTAQRSPAGPLSRPPAAGAALWNFATEARVGAETLPPQLAALRFPGLGENCYDAAMNEIVCERDGEPGTAGFFGGCIGDSISSSVIHLGYGSACYDPRCSSMRG